MRKTGHRTRFYCVIQPDGNYCLWSIARNRKDSWKDFLRGLGRFEHDEAAKQEYQKEGLRCIAVRILPENEENE